jgi:O-antigen/teichoic acid export membrane protein
VTKDPKNLENHAVQQEVRQAWRHSLVYMIGQALSRAVGFFMIPIYTRLISPADYGVLELVTICGGILSLIISFTSSETLARFFYAEKESSRRSLVASTAVIGAAVGGCLLVTLAVSCASQIGLLVFDTHDYDGLIALSFVGSWCAFLLDIGTAYLRLRYMSTHFMAAVVAQVVLTLGLNIYFVVWEELGIRGILYSNIISSLCVGGAITLPILWVAKARFSLQLFIEFVKFGVPLLPSQLGLWLGYLSNRFFLQRYASLTDVGLFSFGYNIGVLVSRFVSTPLNYFWAPRKLELLLSLSSEAPIVVSRVCIYSTILVVFVALLLSLAARDLVKIIAGAEYFRSHEIIPVIGLAIAVGSLENHVNAGMLMEKRTSLLSMCGAISLVVVLVANYMLVPLLGMWGAAIAILMSNAIRVSLVYFLSQSVYPLPFEVVRLLKVYGVALVVYGLGELFVVHDNAVIELGLRVLFACIFPLCLLVVKCAGQVEIAIVRDVLFSRKVVAMPSRG